MTAIPHELAIKLCSEISEAQRGHWYTFNGLWCWGCAKFSGEVSRRCFASRSDFRGCPQINARYQRLTRIEHVPDEDRYLNN